MSIFGKIAKAFFEEDNEETVVGEEFDIEDIGSIKSETKTVVKPEIIEDEVIEQVAVEPVVEEKPVEVKIEPIKTFVDITINESPKEVLRRSRHQNDPLIINNNSEKKFDTVISPIYGKSGSEKELEALTKDELCSAKPKRINPLGTIISPFYGRAELDEFEQKAQEKLHSIKSTQLNEDASINVASDLDNEMAVINKDLDAINNTRESKISGVTLDDLIDNDVDSNEDLMQYSLFGEPIPINNDESEEVSSFTIED